MTIRFLSLSALAFLVSLTFGATASKADNNTVYRYTHPTCDYNYHTRTSPSIEELWYNMSVPPIPFLTFPRINLPIGVKAEINKAELSSLNEMHFASYCFTLDPSVLKTLSKLKMLAILKEMFKKYELQDQQLQFSEGSSGLRWASITGYSISDDRNVTYHSGHLLTGVKGIFAIDASHSAGSKKFQKIIEDIKSSIKLN